MKIEQLLSDVNLSSVVFQEGGSTANLRFLNMTDGRSAGSLACGGVIMFVYQTLPESTLPLYAGESTAPGFRTMRYRAYSNGFDTDIRAGV
jgi:hypothetical protein